MPVYSYCLSLAQINEDAKIVSERDQDVHD